MILYSLEHTTTKTTMEVIGDWNCLLIRILQNIFFGRGKKVIQVWDHIMMIKWWHYWHFRVNCHLKLFWTQNVLYWIPVIFRLLRYTVSLHKVLSVNKGQSDFLQRSATIHLSDLPSILRHLSGPENGLQKNERVKNFIWVMVPGAHTLQLRGGRLLHAPPEEGGGEGN